MPDSEKFLDKILRTIADPTRRRILAALKARGECSLGMKAGLCASDIDARVHLSELTISHHMAVLRRSGLVEGKKVGQWMWYRQNEAELRALAAGLKANLQG